VEGIELSKPAVRAVPAVTKLVLKFYREAPASQHGIDTNDVNRHASRVDATPTELCPTELWPLHL
jgi:hypothetical protein